MRKLKLQMQLSVDGFVAGPAGEQDWMVWDWDDELKSYVNELTEPVDLILLGRKTSEGFLPYWSAVASDPDDESYTFGRKMNDTPKIVFTRSQEKIEGNNVSVKREASPAEINRLRLEAGSDIIVYGGSSLVSSLIQQRLIDEYYLFINPVALGHGLTIFRDLEERLNLKLVTSRYFSCGIVVLVYQGA